LSLEPLNCIYVSKTAYIGQSRIMDFFNAAKRKAAELGANAIYATGRAVGVVRSTPKDQLEDSDQ